jgi:REP element-mobilizing transposase RayT
MAGLFIGVLRAQMAAGRVTVHDFVVMPNHVHILMTLPGDVSVEKAMQLSHLQNPKAASMILPSGDIFPVGIS